MSTDTGPTRGRRAGGREARRSARLHAVAEKVPFITRTMTPLEVLSEEGLKLIEHNAETILEQVGIDFRDPDALATLKQGGADVDGERVRFPRGMARSLFGKDVHSDPFFHPLRGDPRPEVPAWAPVPRRPGPRRV